MQKSKDLLLSGETLRGTPVRDSHDNSIGSIKDVMIDMRTGEVVYAVLAVDDGFLNLGSKFFAIPLQAFQIDTINERMILNIDKERFENAPGFDKDNWPANPQSEFIKTVYTFYNVERFHHAF